MSKFKDFLNENLKDNEFKKEWKNLQSELDTIRAMIDASITDNSTQKELE